MARVTPDGESTGDTPLSTSPSQERLQLRGWARAKEAVNTANDQRTQWLDTVQDARKQSLLLEKHKTRRRILSPEDRVVLVWNIVCGLVVLFVAFELPIRLSFPTQLDERVYLVGEWVLTLYFVLDIAIVFVTAYEDEEGELLIDPRKVALRYARTWLLVDVLGTIPWDLLLPARYALASSAATPADGGVAPVANVLYVLQLPRLLRLLRLPRLLQQMRTGVRRGALGDGPLIVKLRASSSMMDLFGYVLVFLMRRYPPTVLYSSIALCSHG